MREQSAPNGIVPATRGLARSLGQRIRFIVREVPERSRHLQEIKAALSETESVLGGPFEPFRSSTSNVV